MATRSYGLRMGVTLQDSSRPNPRGFCSSGRIARTKRYECTAIAAVTGRERSYPFHSSWLDDQIRKEASLENNDLQAIGWTM